MSRAHAARHRDQPSIYYEWLDKQPTKRQPDDEQIVAVLTAQREDKRTGKFARALGSRKTWLGLRGQAHDVARCTVERIKREQGWEGARYGSQHRTTIPDAEHHRYPDLVDRNFFAPGPSTA